jgi:hypothetical protein
MALRKTRKGRLQSRESIPRPESNEAQKQQHGEGVGGSRAIGEALKKEISKCPHNRKKANSVGNARGQLQSHAQAPPNLEAAKAMQRVEHLRAQP